MAHKAESSECDAGTTKIDAARGTCDGGVTEGRGWRTHSETIWMPPSRNTHSSRRYLLSYISDPFEDSPGRANIALGDALRPKHQFGHQRAVGGRIEAIPYSVDIVDYILNVPIADPIFVWPNRDLVFDLVMSPVHIFVQFDLEAFFIYGRRHGVKMRWVQGKEAEKIREYSMRIPGTDEAWAVHAELPNGDCRTLLPGFLSRPYLNLVLPNQMIEMIKGMPDQLARLIQRECWARRTSARTIRIEGTLDAVRWVFDDRHVWNSTDLIAILPTLFTIESE